jgi:hypothetical protein
MPNGEERTTEAEGSSDLPEVVRTALPMLPPGIFVVAWPGDAERRHLLEAGRLPRLLLVDADAEIPVAADCLEDWVSLPTTVELLLARARTLRAHANAHEPVRPRLGPDGVLRFGAGLATLGQVQSKIMSSLLARFGATVPTDQLLRVGWPAEAPIKEALHGTVRRLRSQIAPLGLEIRTVRSRGYLLTIDPLGPPAPDRRRRH